MNNFLNFKTTKALLFCLVFLGTNYFVSNTVFAQDAIGLSISPPVFEITIAPGKEYKTQFNISNQGGKTLLTPKIVYFRPSDNFGNVNLTDVPAPEWIKFDSQPFSLESGNSKNISVTISPTQNADEIDHYLSLVFVTNSPTDLLGSNSSFYTAKIASNILLTVSKDGNPKKSAEIVEFNSPKLIDSIFGKLVYSVKLKNNGNNFWKPIGKIIINENNSLKLAPQNIISGSTREISCLKDENLNPCKLSTNFLFGKYKAKLEFSLDESPQVYSKETTTYSFPFSLVVIIIPAYIVVLLTRRGKKGHS